MFCRIYILSEICDSLLRLTEFELTNVPGASEVFGYGFVTYAEEAKQKLLGVDEVLIRQYNVVSGPVAVAMAFGAARAAGAELAVAPMPSVRPS